MEHLTITDKLRCCYLKICHLNCPIENNNPFCHDTKCRQCNINWLKFEDAESKACIRCGYHVCDECQLNKNINIEKECPKCGL
jgi:hypothetical protein